MGKCVACGRQILVVIGLNSGEGGTLKAHENGEF